MSQDSPIAPDTAAFVALLAALRAGRGHAPEAAAVAQALAAENVSSDAKADFLRELAEDLWTPTLLAEFAQTFRGLARNPHVEAWAARAIDVCGTGGDHSGSYNVSTTVAFIVAAAGAPVFKHGNRSITSQSGSADFLEKLGFAIDADEAVWRSALRELGFAFFFAPAYHPAFRHIAPARKALAAEKRRTVFNILGPLLNPGRPVHQLVGVFDWKFGPLLAAALEQLGTRRGLIAHGHKTAAGGALDEFSVCGKNFAAGAGELRFLDARNLQSRPATVPPEELGASQRDAVEFDAQNFGFPTADTATLAGGDAAQNGEILHALLEDRAPEGLRDTVLLNAGAALWVAGKAGDLRGGIQHARELLAGGAVRAWLRRAQAFFADVKGRPLG